MREKIIIFGRIPSKKNSRWTTKQGYSLPSKKYMDWEREQMSLLFGQWVEKNGISHPIMIEYSFWFPDARKTDLSNKVEGINDLLVKYGYLEDDNCTVIKKMILSYKGIDRDDPRCEILISSIDDAEL